MAEPDPEPMASGAAQRLGAPETLGISTLDPGHKPPTMPPGRHVTIRVRMLDDTEELFDISKAVKSTLSTCVVNLQRKDEANANITCDLFEGFCDRRMKSLRPKFLLDPVACRHGATAAFTEAVHALAFVCRLVFVPEFYTEPPQMRFHLQDSVHNFHAVENER
ncbi:hypothetical protein FQN60_001299 [Etheostoma spectabile]|uniref:Uncharacterized protein n=1 Tax=Etheostoma spectabile TaxID=54343 RepID=A0A5J5D6A1_9PERO|nr:hypothetical protein FQN60_001299 [Etheostoma spectabile]